VQGTKNKMGLEALLLLGMFLVLSAYSCGTASNTSPPTTTSSDNTVTISGFAFNPSSLTIKKGDTVTWINEDSVEHTVTGANFQSNPIGNGQTYTHTFDQIGTFNYHCSIHPSMQGEIIVQ